MSTDTGSGAATRSRPEGTAIGQRRPRLLATEELLGFRGLALFSTAVLIVSFTTVLASIIDVVGDPTSFLVVVVAAALAATGLARVLSVRAAAVVGAVLLVGGIGGYLLTLPENVLAARFQLVGDVVALLTGLSVLRLQNVELWAMGFAPAPVFLTWYLGLRRRYVGAVLAGGAALAFFMLTDDVEAATALIGVLGAVGTVGFGRLERYGGGIPASEVLATVLAAMVLLTLTVSVAPAGSAQPFQLLGSDDDRTVEGSLINADQRVSILGSIELSPEVRFSVSASEQTYWRVAAYDRYTGGDWIRTGTQTDYQSRLPGPPGRARTITQRYEAEATINTMPAAWRPVRVTGDEARLASVTDMAGLQPTDELERGDSYEVVSRQPVATPAQLRRAGRNYPEEIERRYTQLPASTPDRVERRTERITANADNPYDTARVVERWLENNREYSLDVDRPDGNIADAFLFEMEAGYCTYYATTMVTMLRSQGIPARFVVGYTPGERVGEDRWVVRGLDSHAWVEVYFPETGWVRFDPTPGGPRQDAESTRLATAREVGEANVDTNETGEGAFTPTPTPSPGETTPDGVNATPPSGLGQEDVEAPFQNQTDTPPKPGDRKENGTTVAGEGGPSLPEPPSREQVAFGLVILVGAWAGIRRTGATGRAYRAVWLRWQPRRDPQTDVERAFERLEVLLERRHRPRRPGETPRAYFAAVNASKSAERVRQLHERARYAGEVTEADADEAVSLVDKLARKGLDHDRDLPDSTSLPG